jgi:putative ABC transport system permease protein
VFSRPIGFDPCLGPDPAADTESRVSPPKIRTKEIGIRKTPGASIPNIVMLLTTDFTKAVLMANLIAWPTAYFLVNKWLQNFAYRVDMGLWIFALSGLAALVISWLTVSVQTIRAATLNPADTLR